MTDRAFDVDRVTRLTNAELGSLRGQLCPVEGCQEYDCQALCDRCGAEHGQLVEIPSSEPGRMPRVRTVGPRCSRQRECASCEKVLPRYLLVGVDGEIFCSTCCHQDPLEAHPWA